MGARDGEPGAMVMAVFAEELAINAVLVISGSLVAQLAPPKTVS